MFKEIGEERPFNGILKQIIENIQSGKLKPGAVLPAERTMAETMGVPELPSERHCVHWNFWES